MKYVFDCLPEIKRKLKRPLLMLDFDGTLSPIAPTPGLAILPEPVRVKLRACAGRFPAAIISGRALADVQKKVGLSTLSYAGNHGLEWKIAGNKEIVAEANLAVKSFPAIIQWFKQAKKNYPGTLLENKKYSLSLHYRLLSPKLIFKFKREVKKAVGPFLKTGNIKVVHGKMVIELRPNINWNKGKIALFCLNYYQKKFMQKFAPIYVGDDTTDEDAFAAIKQGVSIRVGKKNGSRAKYYLKNQREIEQLLKWLSESF
ncbi:MAG: trehalose-phosphatase [Candidatus Doudnabacteria bacterium]|nr:trehalose-phosphatase [Candidatus Doudnabacteria bacterium]